VEPNLVLSPRERAVARAERKRQALKSVRPKSPPRSRPDPIALGVSPYHYSEHEQSQDILAMGNTLASYHGLLKDKLDTRFKGLGRAFRLIDADKSTTCDAKEVREGLTRLFNLEHIPDRYMDRMMELMDTNGDGSVRLDEFSRFFSTDHRPESAVDVKRENALRKARDASSNSPRVHFS
jgi:hypothetical protein